METIITEFEARVFNQTKLPSVLKNSKKIAIKEFMEKQLEKAKKFDKIDVEKLNYLQKKMLVSKLVQDWFQSRVTVGKPVGTIAAQSIGERATQQSMKTLHTAGISLGKSSLGGIARVEEILDVKKVPSRPSMKFFLRNKNLSPVEAKVITGCFQFIRFGDLILRRETMIVEKSKLPNWFDTFNEIFTINEKKSLDDTSVWFKFKLDVKKCYMKRIDYLTIANKLKEAFLTSKTKIVNVHFYFSDFYTGEFHVFFDKYVEKDLQNVGNVKHHYYQIMENCPVKGITDITNVFAQNYSIKSFISDIKETDKELEIVYNEKELNRTLVSKDVVDEFIYLRTNENVKSGKIKLNKIKTKKDFMDELEREYDLLGNVCEIKNKNGFFCIKPKKNKGIQEKDISGALSLFETLKTELCNIDGIKIRESDISKEELEKIHIDNPKRVNAGKYWYWETDGSNIKGMMNFGGSFVRENGETEEIEIIYEKLTSNNISNITKVFGIEAGKQLIIDEMVASTSDVHVSHIQELADMMSSQGFMVQVGRHGLIKSGAGHITNSSFEEHTKHMVMAGAYGEIDSVHSIDAAIVTGNLARISGQVSEEVRKQEERRAKALINTFKKPIMKPIKPVMKPRRERPAPITARPVSPKREVAEVAEVQVEEGGVLEL